MRGVEVPMPTDPSFKTIKRVFPPPFIASKIAVLADAPEAFFTFKAPTEADALNTSSAVAGELVPIPTLPADVMRIYSVEPASFLKVCVWLSKLETWLLVPISK